VRESEQVKRQLERGGGGSQYRNLRWNWWTPYSFFFFNLTFQQWLAVKDIRKTKKT